MGFWDFLNSDRIDDKLDDIVGEDHKDELVVHTLELPPYRFVDIYNSIEEFTKTLKDLVTLETQHNENLNDILHSRADKWTDRTITKSEKIPWQIGANEEIYLPRDCFWLCPSDDQDQRFVIRLRFDSYQQKTGLELACSTTDNGELVINQIIQASTFNSIYRNRVLHLAYEAGKKDEYGDVERLEKLQVLFSPIGVVTSEDIVLSSEHIDLFQRNIIDLYERREILEANGVPTRRGILLHGPPGTGKTFACRYICHQLKETTSIFVSGAALANVAALFSLARLLQPSILFIEDADLMFSNRESNLNSTILGELMDHMDGLRVQENISVVMTTNDIDRLEVALKDRPGRISQCIYMGAPKSDLRRRYIDHQLHNFDVKNIDVETLVQNSEGTTQAFIKEWLYRSIQIACERLEKPTEKATLKDADFSLALDEMRQSVDNVGRNIIGFTGKIT